MAESLAFPQLRKEAQGGKEGQRMQKEAKRTQEGQRRQEDATTLALTEEVHQSNAGDYKGGSWNPFEGEHVELVINYQFPVNTTIKLPRGFHQQLMKLFFQTLQTAPQVFPN